MGVGVRTYQFIAEFAHTQLYSARAREITDREGPRRQLAERALGRISCSYTHAHKRGNVTRGRGVRDLRYHSDHSQKLILVVVLGSALMEMVNELYLLDVYDTFYLLQSSRRIPALYIM